MIPRIRGRVGTGDDGKFYFEISLWDLGGTECYLRENIGPYDTEVQAHQELKKCAQFVSEGVETLNGKQPTGKYVDFKDGGILKAWREQ